MRKFSQHYIDGQWGNPSGSVEVLDVVDSVTGEVMGHGPLGTAADAEAAVAAARRAWPAWAETSVADRNRWIRALQAELSTHIDELAEQFTREAGMVSGVARIYQEIAVGLLGEYADLAEAYAWTTPGDGCDLVREPVGVVAAIIPWNYPLLVTLAKVAPALAAGCTAVIKPSEITPFSAFMLAEAAEAVGFPRGVLNVVGGMGPEVGEALVASPDVDAVSFTGSTRAGRRISVVAAETIKRVMLELGGKSPCVVLDDGDLAAAVDTAMNVVTENAGQGCGALSRIVVPRSRVQEAEELAADWCSHAVVGDPFDPTSTIGALSSEVHHGRVTDYIKRGLDDGLRLVAGGPGRPEGLDRGFYVKPTVFTTDDPQTTLAQEEIFGPVAVIIPHDGDDDAVRIANGTIYGLAACVFSADKERAERVAHLLRAGHVDINGYAVTMNKPWGGYKQSGVGRQNNTQGFEEFLEIKALTRLA